MQSRTSVGPTDRVGDYVIDGELANRPGVFESTHILLPRRAHIVVLDAQRAYELAVMLEQLRHPAVPRIYECGQVSNVHWLAVAVIEGPTLAERLVHGPLAVVEVAAMLRDLATALAHAHGKGIVHGGLSAEHVADTRDGWKIVDWSDAGRADDHATDIRALGSLAYAALARALPTMPLARRCPHVPPALARVIDGCGIGEQAAQQVAVTAAHLVEDLAQPELDDEAVPVEIEDIILLDVSRPPPVPMRLRVRAHGTGPVLTKKES